MKWAKEAQGMEWAGTVGMWPNKSPKEERM